MLESKISKFLNKKVKEKNLYDKLLTEEVAYAGLSTGDLFMTIYELILRLLKHST